MTECFGDTSYFLSLLIPTDEYHARAFAWSSSSQRPIVTTEYVVFEVGNFIAAPPARSLFAPFLRTLQTATGFSIVPASPRLLQNAVDLYLQRADKSWSLTDCASFVTMRERNITDALTSDRHFEQAGFNALLRTLK